MTTPRERAIEALSPHAFERAACERALASIEAAGLRIVDADAFLAFTHAETIRLADQAEIDALDDDGGL